MSPTPGILYVTMQPRPSLPLAQFHDWYNNEHGPTRLRLPFVKSGLRYRATDLDGLGKGMPEWMAVYDVTDMQELTKEPYTSLRTEKVKSQREIDTMKQISTGRKLFDLAGSWEAKDFRRLEAVDTPTGGNVLVAVSLWVNPGKGKELEKWYDEEHVSLLSKVPGWRRSRRFVTSLIDDSQDDVEYLALHEYAPENGLGGEEFKAATSTPWNDKVMTEVVREKGRRVYDLSYTFGPAPRDLASVSSPEAVIFSSPDGKTRTRPASPDSSGAIESFVTTNDGVELAYRLEGSVEPDAPLLLLSNSILVEWGIWQGFLEAFFSSPENRKYRVLRYHTRGRTSACGTQAISVDALAADMIALLDAVRIPKAAAVIGVSLGGATALNAALKHPEQFVAFVSCDTSAKSPAGNRKAWGERIEVAEKEGLESHEGEKVVGEELAELTVRRWFHEKSYDGGELERRIGEVKAMVKSNSLEGFKKSVQALYEYDLTPEMEQSKAKGAFVVGGGDGVLPGTMKEMAIAFGKGVEYHVIADAGHLPMIEKPKDFAAVVTQFLAR